MARNRLFEDEKMETKVDPRMMLRLFRYFGPYKKEVAISLFLTMVTAAVGLLTPYLLRISIDGYIKEKDFNGLLIMGGSLIVIHIIALYSMKYRILIMTSTSKQILRDLRQDLFSHIQSLSFSFFDNRPVGKILARVIGDVNSLHDLFNNSISTLLPDIITIVSVAVIMLTMNFKLALVSLTMLPVLLAGMFLIQIISRRRWQTVRQRGSNVNAYIHESFSGIRVIQSFVQEEDTQNIFIDLIKSFKNAWMDAISVNNTFWPMVEISWGIGSILVYWYGVKLLGTTEITVGILIAFTSYVGMFWRPISNLSNFYNIVITSTTAAERIFDIMAMEPDISDMEGAGELPQIKGEIIFDNVSFGYEEGQEVLKNVSFKIKPGETIALVGPTGAGKTTIVNLVSRFYDPKEGAVYIDGEDIREVTLNSLRSQMGIMLQDSFLFSGTIMENIRYGRLDASDEEVMESAKKVHAHDFIMEMENQYNTEVNERGSRLSAGQRQLISFARALLADPRILILDEATSSIDTHTEILVQDALRTLLQGRTSFVIAHRLSTIRHADRIFIVDNKKILEEGNHEELIRRKGLYYELCRAQYKFIQEDEQLLIG